MSHPSTTDSTYNRWVGLPGNTPGNIVSSNQSQENKPPSTMTETGQESQTPAQPQLQSHDDTTFICNACQVLVSINTFEKNRHYGSDWHRYNVKRKIANLEPIPKSLFDQKLAALHANREKMSQNKTVDYYCKVCKL